MPQISHVEFCYDPKTPEEAANQTVQKSASGTSGIRRSWDVDKQVKVAGAADSTYGDSASLALPSGGSGSFTWKVTVTHSQVQSYTVTGTIVLSNTGASAVTGVSVADSIPGATIDCGGGQSTGWRVRANGPLQCSYSVSPGSQVANNTATASWGSTGSATSTATIQWAAQTERGRPAQVEDGGDVDEEIDLDDLTNNQWTTTYDERYTCRNGELSPSSGRTNTATVTWTGGSDEDSASVQVGCGTTPPPPPGTDESMDVQ